MENENSRITELRSYLLKVLDTLTKDKKSKINVDMLNNDINNYSLDKIPTATTITKFIIGTKVCKDVYSFRSRKPYSEDVINNLNNIGFFEKFEKTIEENNKKGILPNIKNIESIECLNCASLLSGDNKSAIFDIQIQITYREEK